LGGYIASMWSRDSAMERRRPLMTSSDRGSDSDHSSPLARSAVERNGNHRRHLSSGGSSDDSSTDYSDQPRNTSGLPVSFASNLGGGDGHITGGGMIRVDSAKHIHEAMATIPGLHKRGKSLELPMTKRLAFRKCRSLTKRLPALLCMGLVVFLLCSAIFKPRGADRRGQGIDDRTGMGTGEMMDVDGAIPRADPRDHGADGDDGRKHHSRSSMPLKLASSIGKGVVHELDDFGRPMLRGAGHAVSSGLSAIGHMGGVRGHRRPSHEDEDAER